jgi:murein L,D-transpeptidase YafK
MQKLLFTIVLFITAQNLYAMAPQRNFNQAVEQAVHRYGLPSEPELESHFKKAHIAYPPKKIALLAFKKEQKLQLWAKDQNTTSWHYIRTYPITATSGRLGPKLKEHDRQIPEGIYRLTSFNPYSVWHLSMMIDYPNSFDKMQASKEGRNKLGGNIFIHGKSSSVGCLAIGDKAIDQLFLLAHRVGLQNVQLIIAPNDLRKEKPATSTFAQPRWLPELYQNIQQALKPFPVSQSRYG